MQESQKNKSEEKRLATAEPYRRPDPNDFDPMAESWWTLPMVASWIIWRTSEVVRNAWPRYRRELRHLNPNDLLSGQIPGAMDIFVLGESITDGSPVVKGVAARDILWRELQKGVLVATGLPANATTRARIDPAEWNDLDFTSGLSGTWQHDAIGRITETEPRYSQVLISADETLKAFASLGPGLYQTGAAGRPSPKNVVLLELVSRQKRGEMLNTLGSEAKYLSEWLELKHPAAPQATAKSMNDIIREKYKELGGKK
jgi:hypothetical protein